MREFDPTDIQGFDRLENDRRDVEREAQSLETSDFKFIMSSPQGRRFMWRLLDKAGVFRSSFTGNSQTFFLEGQRNIGLVYLLMIQEHCPERYNEMVKEQQERARKPNNANKRRS